MLHMHDVPYPTAYWRLSAFYYFYQVCLKTETEESKKIFWGNKMGYKT